MLMESVDDADPRLGSWFSARPAVVTATIAQARRGGGHITQTGRELGTERFCPLQAGQKARREESAKLWMHSHKLDCQIVPIWRFWQGGSSEKFTLQ